ncbi:alpha/beta fold hydrolase [Halosimplex aquaticum]
MDGHDLEVAYYDDGEGDPVIFLHGIPTNSYLWRNVIGLIAEERRVIVPDMLGYGNSSMRDEFDRSIRAQEEMLAALIAALDLGTVSLVGHDLGGGVALRYAVHNPDAVERLRPLERGRVRLVAGSDDHGAWTAGDGRGPERRRGPGDAGRHVPPDAHRRPRRGVPRRDEDTLELRGGLTSLVRAAIATNTNHTTEIDPADITAETLLLWGADDEFQPIESAQRLQDDIDNASLTGLDDATHWVMEDRPEAYREELAAFLVG